MGQLEIVLLMSANPTRVWTSAQLALELRTSPPWSEEQLEILQKRGLVAKAGGGAGAPAQYRYGAHGELHDSVMDLSAAYASYPVAVVTLIYTKPTRSVATFADAFRLRRDPPAQAEEKAGGAGEAKAGSEGPSPPEAEGGLRHG